jgi:hypothetical protein
MTRPLRPATGVLPAGEPPAPEPSSSPGGFRGWQLLALVLAGLLVIGAAVFVATREPAKRPDAGPPPGGGDAPPSAVHQVTGELKDRTDVTLEVLSGSESVYVHSDELADNLYRATTLPGTRVEPVATDEGSIIRLGVSGGGVAGQSNLHVYLNSKVNWHLRLPGGGLDQVVEFVTGRLASIEVLTGTGHVDIWLARPAGTMSVKLNGGAGKVELHSVIGYPTQVTFGPSGNAGTATVDGTAHANAKPGEVITGDGYAKAKDRYDIVIGGGTAQLTIDRNSAAPPPPVNK